MLYYHTLLVDKGDMDDIVIVLKNPFQAMYWLFYSFLFLQFLGGLFKYIINYNFVYVIRIKSHKEINFLFEVYSFLSITISRSKNIYYIT